MPRPRRRRVWPRSPRSPRAQRPQGDDVTRLLDVPFADPGFYVEGESRYIYATGFDPDGWTAFRVSRYDAETGTYGRPGPPWWSARSGSVRAAVGTLGGRCTCGARTCGSGPSPGPRDYVMYFSASRRGGTDCIGMAIADSPSARSPRSAAPLRCGTKGSTLIDPAHFDNPGGANYLLYKRHRYHPKAVGIWAVPVRPDGKPVRGARPFRVVDGGGKQIEAPSVVTRRGRTYLFASRRAYNSCAYRTVVYVGTVHREFRWLGNVGLRRPERPPVLRTRRRRGAQRERRLPDGLPRLRREPRLPPGAARFAWGVPLRWTPPASPTPRPRRRPRGSSARPGPR